MVKKAQHSVLGMVSSRLNSRIFFGGSVKMLAYQRASMQVIDSALS